MANPCKNKNCPHYPAISHDRFGCKLCDCNLDEYGQVIKQRNPLTKESRKKEGLYKFSRSAKIGFYILMSLIPVTTAALSTTTDLLDRNNPNYFVNLQNIFFLSILLGVVLIAYTAIYNHLSDREAKEHIQALKERLDKAGILDT